MSVHVNVSRADMRADHGGRRSSELCVIFNDVKLVYYRPMSNGQPHSKKRSSTTYNPHTQHVSSQFSLSLLRRDWHPSDARFLLLLFSVFRMVAPRGTSRLLWS